MVLRFPFIPGYNTDLENILQTAEFVKSLESQIELNVLPYHDLGRGKYENIGKEYLMESGIKVKSTDVDTARKIFDRLGVLYSIGGKNIHYKT